jgi:hypothetical protein
LAYQIGDNVQERMTMEKKNIVLIALGILLLVIGFFCLAQGPADNPVSLTVAPIVLMIAYLIVIPIGILWGGKDQKK